MLIQCRGCGRSFAPRGLSQHVSKTHDPRCRSALKTSRPQAASPSIQETKTPPPLNPNGGEPISKDRECSGASGQGYISENTEEDISDLDDIFIEQPDPADLADADALEELLHGTCRTVVVEQFPVGKPGAPTPDRAQGGSTYDSQAACMDSLWAPFQSQLDWDVAHWAIRHSQSSSAVSELLAIPGVVETLGLSFRTVKELNNLIRGSASGMPIP